MGAVVSMPQAPGLDDFMAAMAGGKGGGTDSVFLGEKSGSGSYNGTSILVWRIAPAQGPQGTEESKNDILAMYPDVSAIPVKRPRDLRIRSNECLLLVRLWDSRTPRPGSPGTGGAPSGGGGEAVEVEDSLVSPISSSGEAPFFDTSATPTPHSLARALSDAYTPRGLRAPPVGSAHNSRAGSVAGSLGTLEARGVSPAALSSASAAAATQPAASTSFGPAENGVYAEVYIWRGNQTLSGVRLCATALAHEMIDIISGGGEALMERLARAHAYGHTHGDILSIPAEGLETLDNALLMALHPDAGKSESRRHARGVSLSSSGLVNEANLGSSDVGSDVGEEASRARVRKAFSSSLGSPLTLDTSGVLPTLGGSFGAASDTSSESGVAARRKGGKRKKKRPPSILKLELGPNTRRSSVTGFDPSSAIVGSTASLSGTSPSSPASASAGLGKKMRSLRPVDVSSGNPVGAGTRVPALERVSGGGLGGAGSSNAPATTISGARLPSLPLNGGPSFTVEKPPERQSKALRLKFFKKRISKITPFLYMSGVVVASDAEILRENNITHVLNAGAVACPVPFPDHINYLAVLLYDTGSQDIMNAIYAAIPFIEKARQEGGRVLVHCHEGVSRSASVVIAYQMWVHGWTFQRALEKLKMVRDICNPNPGFLCQLLDWHRWVFAGEQGMDRLCRVTPFILTRQIAENLPRTVLEHFANAPPLKLMTDTSAISDPGKPLSAALDPYHSFYLPASEHKIVFVFHGIKAVGSYRDAAVFFARRLAFVENSRKCDPEPSPRTINQGLDVKANSSLHSSSVKVSLPPKFNPDLLDPTESHFAVRPSWRERKWKVVVLLEQPPEKSRSSLYLTAGTGGRHTMRETNQPEGAAPSLAGLPTGMKLPIGMLRSPSFSAAEGCTSAAPEPMLTTRSPRLSRATSLAGLLTPSGRSSTLGPDMSVHENPTTASSSPDRPTTPPAVHYNRQIEEQARVKVGEVEFGGVEVVVGGSMMLNSFYRRLSQTTTPRSSGTDADHRTRADQLTSTTLPASPSGSMSVHTAVHCFRSGLLQGVDDSAMEVRRPRQVPTYLEYSTNIKGVKGRATNKREVDDFRSASSGLQHRMAAMDAMKEARRRASLVRKGEPVSGEAAVSSIVSSNSPQFVDPTNDAPGAVLGLGGIRAGGGFHSGLGIDGLSEEGSISLNKRLPNSGIIGGLHRVGPQGGSLMDPFDHSVNSFTTVSRDIGMGAHTETGTVSSSGAVGGIAPVDLRGGPGQMFPGSGFTPPPVGPGRLLDEAACSKIDFMIPGLEDASMGDDELEFSVLGGAASTAGGDTTHAVFGALACSSEPRMFSVPLGGAGVDFQEIGMFDTDDLDADAAFVVYAPPAYDLRKERATLLPPHATKGCLPVGSAPGGVIHVWFGSLYDLGSVPSPPPGKAEDFSNPPVWAEPPSDSEDGGCSSEYGTGTPGGLMVSGGSRLNIGIGVDLLVGGAGNSDAQSTSSTTLKPDVPAFARAAANRAAQNELNSSHHSNHHHSPNGTSGGLRISLHQTPEWSSAVGSGSESVASADAHRSNLMASSPPISLPLGTALTSGVSMVSSSPVAPRGTPSTSLAAAAASSPSPSLMMRSGVSISPSSHGVGSPFSSQRRTSNAAISRRNEADDDSGSESGESNDEEDEVEAAQRIYASFCVHVGAPSPKEAAGILLKSEEVANSAVASGRRQPPCYSPVVTGSTPALAIHRDGSEHHLFYALFING